MTSLQKTGKDVDSLCEEVNGSMFEDSIYLNATPTYVFEELKGLHHSAEHPLITKGLLASTKREQSVGYRVPSKKGGSNDVPKSRSTTNSFYRANSTHNYLTRTIMLGGSHDGFNPKLGTPTRAQLLRNRVKFTSAPDLTYSYLAQKRLDGRREAVHKKNKMEDELLQLKSSKVEMDRTAGKYRRYMIGSQYNRAKWIESHVNIVQDMMTLRSRPASSVITPSMGSKQMVTVKRRVSSAAANNQHLREARPQSSKLLPNRQTNQNECTKQTSPTPPRARSAPIPTKFGYTASAEGVSVATRTANLIPYTTTVNTPRKVDKMEAAMTIISLQNLQSARNEQRLHNKLELAKQLTDRIQPIVEPQKAEIAESKAPAVSQIDDVASNHNQLIINPVNSTPVFVTDSQGLDLETGNMQDTNPANSSATSDNDSDVQVEDMKSEIISRKSASGSLSQQKPMASLSVEIKMSNKAAEDSGDKVAHKTHSVSVELPAMDDVSDTLSATLDAADDLTYTKGKDATEKLTVASQQDTSAEEVNLLQDTPVHEDTSIEQNASAEEVTLLQDASAVKLDTSTVGNISEIHAESKQ
ncbi:hypothetical protein EB796_003319 [Bugula neritina]|uniref:Uncharacterized protein n=1 Tax=Bugula neritina TaxID=10212 RepID=A0A7J7KL10_BUGNE|nr:hypothetical protein EB796_003319 [Bugula neritina]